MARPKLRLELTGKQMRYLKLMLGVAGIYEPSVKKEYMYLKLEELIEKGCVTADKEDEFYLEKAYFKAYKKTKQGQGAHTHEKTI